MYAFLCGILQSPVFWLIFLFLGLIGIAPFMISGKMSRSEEEYLDAHPGPPAERDEIDAIYEESEMGMGHDG